MKAATIKDLAAIQTWIEETAAKYDDRAECESGFF